jgi:choline transport protein
MVRKRVRGEALLPSRFSLGKWGLAVNLTSLCYLSLTAVLILFPSVPNPAPIDMNWASPIFGCLVIFAMIYYFTYGRHTFDGPVAYCKQQ